MASENKSRILGIQFGMLSPEEIENMSVCEITSRDTYINNKPGSIIKYPIVLNWSSIILTIFVLING